MGGSSSTGAPNIRPSHDATATTEARLVGAYGTRPNDGAHASGEVASAQAIRAVTTASGGKRMSTKGRKCLNASGRRRISVRGAIARGPEITVQAPQHSPRTARAR